MTISIATLGKMTLYNKTEGTHSDDISHQMIALSIIMLVIMALKIMILRLTTLSIIKLISMTASISAPRIPTLSTTVKTEKVILYLLQFNLSIRVYL